MQDSEPRYIVRPHGDRYQVIDTANGDTVALDTKRTCERIAEKANERAQKEFTVTYEVDARGWQGSYGVAGNSIEDVRQSWETNYPHLPVVSITEGQSTPDY